MSMIPMKVHEVSIIREVQEGDAVHGPYRKYIDLDLAQIGKYWNMRRTAAIVRKFASAFPNLNKSTVHSYHAAKVQRRIKQAEKEQRELKQVIANKRRGKPLLGDIDGTVRDYLKVSEFIPFIQFKPSIFTFTAPICACCTQWGYKHYFDLTVSKLCIGQENMLRCSFFAILDHLKANLFAKKIGH